MAKYDKDTKFYWLQLKEDFFDDDAIDWLEEQPNGKEYSLFYLKLCLKSLRTNGILIRQVGQMLIPYDAEKLGELTKTNSDTVMVAMNLLMKIGLVQKLENGELYMTQVENMIGSKSLGAFKKQQQRALKPQNEVKELPSGQEEDKCPPKKEIDLEKDLEIEKEKEKEGKSKYGQFKNVLLTPTEFESLSIDYENHLEAIEYLSEYLATTGKKYKSHYLVMRKWVFDAVREKKLKKIELEQREKRATEIKQKNVLKELKDFYGSHGYDERTYSAEEMDAFSAINSNLDDLEI